MLDINELVLAYTNEKSTKKLLKYREIVGEFSDLLKRTIERDELLEECMSTSENHANNGSTHFTSRIIQEMESDRIKYFIKEYIFIRMHKIMDDLFVSEDKLSEQEIVFCRKYKQTVEAGKITIPKKGYEKPEFVGFVASRNISNVKIDGEPMPIDANSFIVAEIREIMTNLENDEVWLV